jgi:hypothetical protein
MRFKPQRAEDHPPVPIGGTVQPGREPLSHLRQPKQDGLSVQDSVQLRLEALALLGNPGPLSLHQGQAALIGLRGSLASGLFHHHVGLSIPVAGLLLIQGTQALVQGFDGGLHPASLLAYLPFYDLGGGQDLPANGLQPFLQSRPRQVRPRAGGGP